MARFDLDNFSGHFQSTSLEDGHRPGTRPQTDPPSEADCDINPERGRASFTSANGNPCVRIRLLRSRVLPRRLGKPRRASVGQRVTYMQSLASCRIELSDSLELLVCCVAHPIQRSTLVCVRLLPSSKPGGDASEASFNQKEVVNLRKVVSQVEVNRFAKLLPDVEHCKDCQDPTSEE